MLHFVSLILVGCGCIPHVGFKMGKIIQKKERTKVPSGSSFCFPRSELDLQGRWERHPAAGIAAEGGGRKAPEALSKDRKIVSEMSRK